MPTNVTMPLLGESVLEGTIIKWMKQSGDRVVRDEPLYEISTDKVDSEIACPADGILAQIIVPEGTTVKVGALLAVIEDIPAEPAAAPSEKTEPAQIEEKTVAEAAPEPEAGASVGTAEAIVGPAGESPEDEVLRKQESGPPVEPLPVSPEPVQVEETVPGPETAGIPAAEAAFESAPAEGSQAAPPGVTRPVASEPQTANIRTSPLVRKIAREYGIDLSRVEGTGLSGRITREDISAYLRRFGKTLEYPAPPPTTPRAIGTPKAATAQPAATLAPPESAQPRRVDTGAETAGISAGRELLPPIEIPKFSGEVEIVTMSPMRRAIADHMVLSRRTSAHVQTVFEVDMTSVVRLREKHIDEFEQREGFKLSYTPFFVKALVDTVRDFPILNCSVSGDKIIYKKPINVGIAVALDTGLIVPVIRDAQLKSFTGLALAVHDLAERARARKLKPEEVQQGTITITNPGPYGSLFGTPIINQPQVAILGIGGLEKRPMVIGDGIAIRTMVYLVLSFDHRVIDGAVADQFMAALKKRLESWTRWVE